MPTLAELLQMIGLGQNPGAMAQTQNPNLQRILEAARARQMPAQSQPMNPPMIGVRG
jgi:hypothetical protein